MTRIARASWVATALLGACTGLIDSPHVDPPKPGDDSGVSPPPDSGVDPLDGGEQLSGLPCELSQALTARCGQCHGAVLAGGAPYALLTRDDLLTASPLGGTRATRSLARLMAGNMPPPPSAAADDAKVALSGWLQAGMPGGACGGGADGGVEELPSLTRSSTHVIAERLRGLFPTFDVKRLTGGLGAGQRLGQADQFDRLNSYRATDALAQRAMRDLALELCGTPNTFFQDSSVWLPGENRDAGALPLIAARRAFGIPVLASDPAVVELARLERELRADAASETEVRSALCVATLLSPQFWLGHDSTDAKVLRLAQNLAGRVPTRSEWDQLRSGALTIEQWVAQLQAEPGYVSVIADWHRTWLGPKDWTRVVDWNNPDPRGGKYHYAWNAASALAGQLGMLQQVSADGGYFLRFNAQNLPDYGFTNGELCDFTRPSQPFDPVTVGLRFEHRNPINGRWETVGSWSKNGANWVEQPGAVSLADGGTLSTTLHDLSFAPAIDATHFGYERGRLMGTPVATFAAADARWVRIAASGPQDGWSEIETWYTGQRVGVCNSLGRFLATCAFQPPDGGSYPALYTRADLDRSTYDVTRPEVILQMNDGVTPMVNSLAHPLVLDSFRCGVPAPDTVGKFPVGPPFNTVAASVKLMSVAYDPAGNPRPISFSAGVPELSAVLSVAEDFSAEPEALVREIISSRLDYRELLTADWTNGRGPLELSYRTKAYFVPARAPGYQPQTAASPRRISARVFDSLSAWWVTNPTSTRGPLAGLNGFLDTFGNHKVENADLSSARPMSGILTQGAFLAPAGYKVRSVAARIIRTLTCEDVAGYAPAEPAASLHASFIPHGEPTAAPHVDAAAGCYSCHINLDPLAAALSGGFLRAGTVNGNTISLLESGGELGYYATGDLLLEKMTYGMRGVAQPSAGAFRGQAVRGVREVAQVLANSRPFARCATSHAFNGLFGRPPQGAAEQRLVDEATDRFVAGPRYDYDAMVRVLALSPLFQVVP